MATALEKEIARRQILKGLERDGIQVIQVGHGWRLVGLFGDITVIDPLQLSQRELSQLTRIRT